MGWDADCGLRITGKRGLGSGVLTPAIATFLIAMVRIYNVLSRKLNFKETIASWNFGNLKTAHSLRVKEGICFSLFYSKGK